MANWFYVRRQADNIIFEGCINGGAHRKYMSAVSAIIKDGLTQILLDFSGVDRAYHNGMVPILCSVDTLRQQGFAISVVLPDYNKLQRLFINTNWAHFLCPEIYMLTDTIHDRHLAVQRYTDSKEQQKVVNNFIDVVMRSMTLDRRVIAGLEWSINEITDNVLNHSASSDGGFVQVMTNRERGIISFSVGDSGRGILASMKEAFPTMKDHAHAIGEAVKAGVTSRQDYGQGNGLAGTLRIATWSGGQFSIMSGNAQLEVEHDGSKDYTGVTSKTYHRHPDQYFSGTLVTATISLNSSFPLEEALGFGKNPHHPVDIIEIQYETDDGKEMILQLKHETTGFGTRTSGMQIRNKAVNLLNANPTKPLIIDWDGIPLISSSFADEFVGKLYLDLGPLTFSTKVRNTNMESLVSGLIDRAIKQRIFQQMKDSNY